MSTILCEQALINQVSLYGCGHETPLDGIEMAHRLDFHKNATKFVILITDEPYSYSNNRYGISTMQELADNLKMDEIYTSVVCYNRDASSYAPLYSTTTVKEIPSREDSLDRLAEIGKDFADSNSDFQDSMVLKIMLDEALAKLSDEERYLITQLFYLGRTERDLANELGISQYTVNRNKHKILKKLKDEMGG